jgi:catechol 2,3-dioxygenase-like lactoylglutathione lyase family enzyme
VNITQTAISLNVPDVAASASFAKTHFGFEEAMSAEGFVSLQHPGSPPNVIFLETGLSTFRPREVAGSAGEGTLLVFVVDDIDGDFARIADAGARVVTPPETEPWGERFCQFADPNGLIWQLVQWVD